MKIAISATGPSLDAEVDPRFGRCQYFIIVDPQTLDFEAVENASAMASGGAGIATAQMVANKGVQAILTGNAGPNAYQTLAAAGIQVFTGATGKIRDVIEGYKAGRFQAASQPTVDAHFGSGGRGMGMGGGIGLGMVPPTGPSQPPSPGQELEMLKTQAQMLGQQLNGMMDRIEGLEKKGE
ncbi:NifB/NifX family molybdenum-iron cluster-binding protein [Chloroflexota bacterium]